MTRVKEERDLEIEVNILYEAFKFEMLESTYYINIGKRIFVEHLMEIYPNISKQRINQKGVLRTLYKGITLKQLSTQKPSECSQLSEIKQFLTPDFLVKDENESKLTCDVECDIQINGNQLYKRVTFFKTKEWTLEISGQKVDLASVFIKDDFEMCQESIRAVCASVKIVRLCEAVTITKSVVVSRFHTVEQFNSSETQERKIRSIICSKIVSVNSVTNTCRKCQKMTFGQPKNELSKENVTSKAKEDKDMKTGTKAAETTKEDIKRLFPNANEEMIEILLSQAKNISRDPKGRRWSKGIIAVCLQWYCRSPQSYQAFRDSKYLVLPSPSMLVLYKNRVKQEVGFDKDVFKWMHEEAKRRNLPEGGWTGGIILDEMSIQSDIQISKSGDMVELSGLVEAGEEGNICNVIRTGKKDKTVGTHVLQMVFLGISGFRFPFSHFITDGIQAPELYTLFWEAVDKLQTFGFNVVYTCMDGAQSNRSFMKYNIGEASTTFTSPCPCSLGSMIFMMDVSHVIKKIRNNVLKSGVQKQSTRLLTLPSSHTVQWQMFIDCFHWDKSNAFQLHKKLTNEHLFPSTQSKMRNHLADEVLNNDMLHLMLQYKLYLGPKGCVLDGAIEFLRQTSKLIEMFRGMRPVRSTDDERLHDLQGINDWFLTWESTVNTNKELSSKEKSAQLMSYQCHEDIHACLIGFLKLCGIILKKGTTVFITPALINSDVIENTFNQMRSTYNGANSNPNALQYRRTLNSIVLGQKSVSMKANAGKTRDGAFLFNCNPKKRTVKRKTHTAVNDKKTIKVIRC